MTSATSLPAAGAMLLDGARTGTLPSSSVMPHKAPQTSAEKAWSQAQDFEAMFLNSMMQTMFTSIGEDGPLGNSQSTGVWRSMLVDEYSKNFAKAGGIGLAKHVYSTLLSQQEARSAAQTKTSIQ
ncbi:flagellar assembly peptidoglycan hydrolase FlgJ [Rhodoplanes roseus]|uniref:Flagellar protein FlgJ N-terminal domain-containing protein n=1 Tax=Rhodoplanes roseus TaxID=29409 RepID=A0A327L371_9BRAD|nr:flagellar assembly peptidoglycan hydrolase FlgJ [Rhodoplanes roseus]RAI45389.1 hypothetical protein CH341_04335 [Rhodoplanes roseus]